MYVFNLQFYNFNFKRGKEKRQIFLVKYDFNTLMCT